jgi:nicotinamidase-related amidase
MSMAALSTTELRFDIARTALLVMDFQAQIVERFVAEPQRVLAATAVAMAAARAAGLRIVHVVCGFRPGFPEVSPRNPVFSAVKASGGWTFDIHPRVAPNPDEAVVTKRRTSAFMGTDLEIILRAHAVDTLVMCGVNTSGVVLSSVRYAADSDFRIVVLRDACSDPDPQVHACLVDKIFPRQATVIASEAFADMLGQAASSPPHG